MIITEELAELFMRKDCAGDSLDIALDDLREQIRQNQARIVLVRFDETQFWNIDLKGAHCFGVYLTDLNRKVHCCELTASYELYPLYHYTDSEDEKVKEQVDEEPMDSDVVYVHCSRIDKLVFEAKHSGRSDWAYLPPDHESPISKESDLEETYDKFFDSLREHYRGNWAL